MKLSIMITTLAYFSLTTSAVPLSESEKDVRAAHSDVIVKVRLKPSPRSTTLTELYLTKVVFIARLWYELFV